MIGRQLVMFSFVIVGWAIVESSLNSILRHRSIDGHVVFDLQREEPTCMDCLGRVDEGVSRTHSFDLFIRLIVACFTRKVSSMLEKISVCSI